MGDMLFEGFVGGSVGDWGVKMEKGSWFRLEIFFNSL